MCRATGAKCKGNWRKLSEAEQKGFYGIKPVRIVCPKGSMVLWDSRTAHCGVPPEKAKIKAGGAPKNRMVVFVSMQPRRRLSAKNAVKKKTLFKAMRTTTHWAADRIKVFGKKPRLYAGQTWPELAAPLPPVLTRLGLRIAGF
jgi:hypothetical protein